MSNLRHGHVALSNLRVKGHRWTVSVSLQYEVLLERDRPIRVGPISKQVGNPTLNTVIGGEGTKAQVRLY